MLLKPMDVQLNGKPLFGKRIPVEAHEGPCRPGDPTTFNREKEQGNAKKEYDVWEKTVKSELGNHFNILDPIYVEYDGDHRISDSTWKKITDQDSETDFYLLSHYRIPGLEEKTDKPIIVVGNECATLDVPARLQLKGKEAYGVIDYSDLKKFLPGLKVRKALKQTKILNVTNGKWDYEYNVVRSTIDPELLRNKFGIENVYISIYQMMEEFEKVKEDKEYLKEAETITKKLAANAEQNFMEEKDIQLSVLYYLTAKKLMKMNGCNSFTATCQEFCMTKLPMKYKVTPCLTHSLLKDEGYISTCEGDLNVLLSMALQMYLTKKTAYMGNTLIQDQEKNLVFIWHNVPGLKMKGYDQPDLPYRLVGFTERNWGATIRYDFSLDKGEPVTFCRLTPDAKKLLVIKGTLEDVKGLDDWGCSLKVVIKVSNAKEYFQKATQTGHHFSMIYGDYSKELNNLCSLLKIDFEVI